MSTRYHDKTVETADNPVYNVLCVCVCFFFYFILFIFVNVVCVFKRVSTQLNLFVCNILKVGSCPHDDNYGQILMLSFSV